MTTDVLVTGALGGVGRWVTDAARERGAVVAVDRTLPASGDPEGVRFQAVDLRDQGSVLETVLDADPSAVVHLGNIPHEGHHTGGDVYENNALSTYHVLDAAGRAGADVVWASSETVYGTHWPEPTLPASLPVGEGHPVAPWNGYETSKLAGEAAAERVANAFDVSVVTMRPSWVQYPGAYETEPIREGFTFEGAGRFGNLWSYVDVRDVVSFVEAALTADVDGHEVFNVFGPDNFLGVETARAIRAGYGSLPEDCEIRGAESAFSTAKAESVLGWEPEHSWRTAADEAVDGPAIARPR